MSGSCIQAGFRGAANTHGKPTEPLPDRAASGVKPRFCFLENSAGRVDLRHGSDAIRLFPRQTPSSRENTVGGRNLAEKTKRCSVEERERGKEKHELSGCYGLE